VGLRHSRVGEDTQADIPRISEVNLRFLRSRRNTIGRSRSPYRPHRSLPRWRWYGGTRLGSLHRGQPVFDDASTPNLSCEPE
jgi:hypothetical protein